MRVLLLLLIATAALALEGKPRGQARFCPPAPAQSCDVSVSKAGPADMIIGFDRDFVYQINVVNAGPNDAENVYMDDIVPAPLIVRFINATYSNGTISCTRNGNAVQCFIPVLRAPSTARILVNVTVPSNAQPAVVNNTARVNTTTCDNDPSNNQNSALSNVILSADLAVDITGPSFSVAGQSELVNNTVRVVNQGSSDAQSVTATYLVPQPLVFVSVQSADGSCSYSQTTRLVTCQFGTLTKNQTRFFTVTTSVPPDSLLPAGGIVTFRATVNSTTPDPNPINNVDEHDLQINIDSNMAITKSGPARVTAGLPSAQNPAFYTLVVENSGPSDALGVFFSDPLPLQFNLLSVSTTCFKSLGSKRENVPCTRNINCTLNQPYNFLACTVDYVSVNEAVRAVISFSVNSTVAPQVVNNTAFVTSQTADSDPRRNQDSHLVQVEVASDVAVTKQCPPGTIISGVNDTYFFLFSVQNNGPSVARNVTFADTVPVPMVVVGSVQFDAPINPNAVCSRNGNVISCTFGDLAPGQRVAFRVGFTVPANAFTLGNIVNTASVALSSFDPILANNEASCPTLIVAAPDVAVDKTGPRQISVDSNRTTYFYTIVVTNRGPSNAQNVYMEDTLPAPFVLTGTVTLTGGAGTCATNGNTVNCTIGTLTPQETRTIVVPFFVPGTAEGNSTIRNIARVFHTTPDTNTTNNESEWPVILIRLADVAVVKFSPGTICAGDPAQLFTIQVSNNGPADAQFVTLEDVVDPRFVPGTSAQIVVSNNASAASCSFTGQRLSCSLGGIPFNGRVTVTFPFTVAAGTPAQTNVPNTAVVSSAGNDPNLANNQFTVPTNICTRAPLTVQKTGPNTVLAGSGVQHQYTIVATNPAGPSDAINATLTDIIPSQFTYVANSASATLGGQCTVTTASGVSTLQCTWARFPAFSSATVTFLFTVDQDVTAQTVVNTACFFSATPPTTANSPVCSNFTTQVNVVADMSVTKASDQGACAGDGQTYYYTVTLRNNGPSRARNIALVDAIPSQLTPGLNSLITIAGAQAGSFCSYSGNTLSCSLGSLPSGGVITVRFPFSVAASVFQQTVTNIVNITSDFDQVSTNNQAVATTPICNIVDLVQEKAGPARVSAGNAGNYTYTLAVSNRGPSDAINVTVTDVIPNVFDVVGAPIASGGGQCVYTVFGGQTTLVCGWPRIVPNAQRETVVITFRVAAGVAASTQRNCALATATVQQDSNPANNQACVDTVIDVLVDLSVTKNGPGILCASQTGTFRLSVTNGGPAVAFNVNLTDVLPVQFTPNTQSITISGNQTAASCFFAGQQLTCQLGRLDVGGNIVVTYTVTVPASERPGQAINTVVVNSTTTDGSPLNNQASHTTQICAQADIAVFKAAPVEAVAGLGGYVYTLTIRNNGPADASSVTLTDPVPAVFPHGAFISTGSATCTWDGNNLSCIWPGLFRVGQSENVSFFFSVPADTTDGSVQNCVTGASTTEDNVPSNNRACNTTNVVSRANLLLQKRGPDTVCAGADEPSLFTVTITNAGPSVARFVTLVDPLPAGLTAVASPAIQITGAAAGATCSYNFVNNSLSCSLGTMAVNAAPIIVTFPFRVAASVRATSVTNVATVGAQTQDPDGSANNAQWTVRILECIALSIVKAGPSEPVIAGDNRTWQFRLTASNTGVSDARNVRVTDTATQVRDVTILGVSSTFGANCSVTFTPAGGNVITCLYALLPARTTDTITITFTSPASAEAGDKQNCALIESNSVTNNTCIPFVIGENVDIRTVKTGATVIDAGANGPNQVFTVTVTNFGPSDARSVTLRDPVPSIFTVTQVNTTRPSCSLQNNVVSCAVGTLRPGESFQVTYSYTTSPDAALGTVRNTACATTTTNETVTNNNCANWDTIVRCRTALRITKTSNVTTITAGTGAGAFTVTVTNDGPSSSQGTEVTDTWPAGLTAGTVTASQGSCISTATGFFCNIGRLAPNASATVVLQFTAAANVVLSSATNTACAKNTCVEAVCATVGVAIIQRANLFITKDDCVTEVVAGNPLPYTYSIRAVNNGPSDAANVVITDTWPAVFTRGTVTAQGGTCTLNGNAGFQCVFPLVSVGQSVTITVSYTVADSVLPGFASNCVVVTSSTPEIDTSDNTACDTNAIVTLADLDIRKTIDSDVCVVAGSQQQRTYTLTVTNLGPSIARNVRVFEQFPTELNIVPGGFPVQCTAAPGTSNYTCSLGDMRTGEIRRLLFTFTVDAARRPGVVRNVVSTFSDTRDPDLCNNNATLCSLICVESDLAVTKTDNVDQVTAGDGITYTYTYTGVNLGPSDAPTVIFTDKWPRQIAWGNITAPNATCTWSTTGFECRLNGGLRVGQSYTFTATYRVPACLDACEICNTVTISSPDSPDPRPSNNVATDCTAVRTEADLAICKTDGYDEVTAGDRVRRTYTVVVTNNGPSCAQKVRVVDHFPRQVVREGVVTTTQGSCIDVAGSNDFSCHLLTLAPGQTVTILATYVVPSSAITCSITNVATVSSITFDPALCNNDARDVNALREKALLTISKTDGLTSISQNDNAAHFYTITYTNTGPSTARDVVLTDRWPAMFVQYINGIEATNGTTCISTGGDFTCTSGDLAVGASVTVRVRFSLMVNTACNTTIVNRASVFSPTDDECRHAQDSTTVVNCLSPTQVCRTCLEQAIQSGQCSAVYAACRQNALCNACYNSVLANPAQPINSCFSDVQSCRMLQCTYNDFCGVGRGGPCDSPFEGPVLCPTGKRTARSEIEMVAAPTLAPVTTTPAGRMLAPKMMAIEVKRVNTAELDITMTNPLAKDVTVQDVEAQVTHKGGRIETIKLTETSATVEATTCELAHVRLSNKWSYSCKVTAPKLLGAEVTSVKIIVRGFSEAVGGYHPILASKSL